jgi:GAF domain-containing protein
MTDTKPVFDAIVHNLLRLFGTRFATVHLLKDGMVHLAALDGEPGFERLAANFPRPLDDSTAGRVMHLKQVLQFAPVIDNPATPPATKRFAREYTFNSILAAPMMRGHEVIGAIVTARRDPIAFDDKQIALIKSFAAQAVIAIENARLLNELRQRTDDLSESLEQQTATSEVLQVISSSPGELEPVFNAMLANATRICGATIGTLYLYEGSRFCGVALHHTKQSYVDWWRRNSVVDVESNSGLPLSRLARTKQTVHIPDLRTDQSYIEKNDRVVNLVEVAGVRTFVSVPMLKEGELIGAINLYRQEVRPFTDKQIELVQNFAAQAVIAIENTRLLNELRESLQQQTATADVLKVISSSPGELEPVFNAMLANATRLCNAEFGTLNLYDGDVFHIEAVHNVPPEFAEARLHELIRPHPSGGHARVIRTKDVVQIEDIRKGQAYLDGDPSVVAVSDLGGARTIILVPMLKDDDVLVGTIAIYRKEVLPFTEKQIELVKNFAAQAVIAIENTRLLNELRESLQQQTATADVLKVISSSPGDLEPVFQAMLQKATQICEAKFGVMFRFADDEFRAISWLANTPAYIIEHPHVVGENPHNFLTRIVSTKRPVHSSDLTKERAYIEGNPRIVALVETAGARSLLVVPMVKNEELIGAIAIYWQEVRSFTEKQIELISNFAAQAVIAIDNARLLSELRESLQQQTATADVLKVISRSTFDLHTVLDTLVESAARLCEADMASINREKGTAYQQVASYGQSPEFQAYMATHPISAGRGSVVGRTVMQGGIVHIPDVLADPDFKMIGAAKVGGIHTMLGVPLLREGTPIGVIVLQRKAVQPFTDKQIELVETFADQAVIAIENTRLLGELRESLQQQTSTADVLKVISRSTFDLRTVLQTLIESAARLCDADKGNITREKGGIFYRAAESYGYSPEFLDHIKGMPIEMDRGSATGRSLLEKRVIHIRDAKADPEYTLVEAQRLGDYRTVLAVPMLREGIPLGVLTLTRSEVRPFTDKQIELVTTFADQAAIAIENVRLFESVEARTRELAKSLEDLRTTQDRLVQTQKLASLGQLTAGIAHEIKNPLNFVNNFSGVSAELIDELQDTVKGIPLDDKARAEIKELTDTLKGNLDKIVQHGKRADAIVKNMLLHSREGSGEHRPVDVNALVEESLNLAYHGARAEKQGFTITLQRSFDPTVGEADIFPQDIIRALLNLIINGFYAATKRRAEANGGNYEPTLAAATKNLGDRVEITIRDNGIGVPLDVKEKMFNPFFTTKPAGEGTGLGLSISHDIIVKQHGGSIEVETQPGEFTEIKVILPRVAALLPERL